MGNSDAPEARHSPELCQQSLFSSTPEEFTAETQVSTDEMNSWFHENWISFDPSAITEYSERERVEVIFVRGLARSGLSDAMINRIFSAGLQRPYCYDSDKTFFSFVQDRWISLPPERDHADVTAEYVDGLAGAEDWDALRDLQARITLALESAASSGADLNERYQFDTKDHGFLGAAEGLLRKVAVAESTRPAELVSVAKLQVVLSRLPRVTSGMDVKVWVASPRRNFEEIETWHWWEVAVEGERLCISSGGHFYQPSTGSDNFTTMTWAAIPEEASELNDYRESLGMVPGVLSFPDGVASIGFASGGYKVEVTDEDNPLLDDDEDSDEDADRDESEPALEPDEESDDEEEEAASGDDEPGGQQTLFSREHEPGNTLELYRRDGMVEAAQKDWRAALLTFQEMGWQPTLPLEAYAHPLTFIKHDEGEAMQRAGRSLLVQIQEESLLALMRGEPFVSPPVQVDLGLFNQLTEFVGGGAFTVGRPGSYEHAKANDF